jgi:hypothetical protein
MVVAVTRDSATPYSGGFSLAETVGASLLTVEGQQHGVVFIAKNPCIEAIAADYLKLSADGSTRTF